MDIFNMDFNDAVLFDSETKTVISVRDGVQEYKGHELGLAPPDKVFTLYRAPETIKAIVDQMAGLPLTDDHVSLDMVPNNPVGKIVDAELVDSVDDDTKTTVNIKNRVSMDFDVAGKQLSLGYRAGLIDCEVYDFEQVDIVPHHLAIVQNGRCGNACKFTDKESGMKKKLNINAAFLDANDQVNMAQVMDIVANLPEAIKTMPIKELSKLIPVLQKVTAAAVESIADPEGGAMSPEEEEAARQAKETADAEDLARKEKEEQDANDAAAKEKETNDKAFSDSVAAETKKKNAEYATVIIKAKDFLPDTYAFADKNACDIMRDALATQHNDKFEDSELPTAFKMLKSITDYQKFGDSKTTSDIVDEIGEKEL
ncbi:DUF2213 domain-containing protein [Candidatus Pacearchaeota archaeon]|nr:DUF2213 domain-containing protein [Candidatus Pacearchaeota archaeon]